jgi:hypothetical protein
MQETIRLINSFEKRNNISIAVTVYGDGTFGAEEFWDNEKLNESANVEELHDFLRRTKYKLGEDGLCLSPVQIESCTYCGKDKICDGLYPEGCFLENDINSIEGAKRYLESEGINVDEVVKKGVKKIEELKKRLEQE